MDFDFYTANRIIFGPGKFEEITQLVGRERKRCFAVTGKSAAREAGMLDCLDVAMRKESVELECFSLDREPTVSIVDDAVGRALDFQAEIVIGLGGGSALDLGKAVSGVATNGGSVLDYLEGVGKGAPIEKPSLPYIAIPTTAGTGSEVTKNAVICSDDGTFKKSIRSPHLIPDVALVDPELTKTMQPALTAACGFDALSQLIESLTSNCSNSMTDALALAGIERVARSLYAAWSNGENMRAREDMAFASLMSGMTLTNAGLGAVHGLAAPLGALHSIPHGITCAILLPGVIEANVNALLDYDRDSLVLEKYSNLAMIFCRTSDDPFKMVERIQMMMQMMKMPGLGEFGFKKEDIPQVVEKSRGSSMKYNPIELTDDKLTEILEQAL